MQSRSREMFQTAQWAPSSEAAQSLAQMAARGAKGDPRLAALVRERQDLVAEWQKRDGLRNAGSARRRKNAMPKPKRRIRRGSPLSMRGSRKSIRRLAAKFPDYAALAQPGAAAVEEVQAQLGADEALVLFLDTPEWKPTPEETFIWVVTKTDLRWVRSDLGTAALTREVQALRCGLDAAAWEGRAMRRTDRPKLYRGGPGYRQAAALRPRPRALRFTRRCSARLRTSSKASSS